MRHDLVGAFLEQCEDLLVRHPGRKARTRRGRGGRRLQALAGFRALDVARDNAAVRAGAGDARKVNADVLGEAAGERRREDAGVTVGLRSGSRRLRRGSLRRSGCCGFWRGRGGRCRFRGGGFGGLWCGRGPCSGAGRLHVLAIAGHDRDNIVDGNVLRAFGHQDFRNRALVDCLDLHGRLVGLDLRDHVAGLDLVALFLEPLGKVALFHRGRQRGHQNVDRHCQ